MPFSTQVVMDGRRQMEQDEAPAAADVVVGDLLEFDANAHVLPHGAAGEPVDRVVVALDARGRGFELGDAYDGAAGENVPYALADGSTRLHMRIAAGVSTVAEQTRLVSNGDGTLRAFDGVGGDVDADVIAVAAESVDNSGGTEPAYCGVEVVS